MAILEHHVADVRALLAHLAFGFADGDALQVRRHEEGGDAPCPFVRRIGARHQREDRRLVRVGDEALRAVDDVVFIAFAHGGGAHRRRVGARARFGEAEACDRLAAREFGQPLFLLIVAAEHDDALAADADIGADDRAERGRGLAQFEADQDLLFHGEAEAAVFGRDRNAEEAELAHLGHHVVGDEVVARDFVFDRDQPFAHEAADGGDQLVAGFEIERHAAVLDFIGISKTDVIRSVTASHRQNSAVSGVTLPSHWRHVASHVAACECHPNGARLSSFWDGNRLAEHSRNFGVSQ